MINDLLRKGLAWAKSFFWVSDSDAQRPAKSDSAKSGAAKSGPAKSDKAKSSAAKPGTSKTGGAKSRASTERRPAAEKTSTNKRSTTTRPAAKRGASKTGGAKAGAAKTASPTAKPAAGKSTDPGAAAADLTEIKGIGPAMKTKLAALGITSFADLAGADAKQLAQKLDSRTLSADRVRAWIAEAKKRS